MPRLDPAALLSRRTGQLFFEELQVDFQPPDLLVQLGRTDALGRLSDSFSKAAAACSISRRFHS